MDEKHNSGPLEGILVLDHTSALAGPYCTQLLGDLGADVIKIEQPGKGDQSRGWGPPFVGKDKKESAYFLGTNRNKRGLTLNLSTPEGHRVLNKLLAKADVLVHNVPRESSRKKLGLDEESCHSINPQLIWANITGFGNTGPYAERPGYDVIAQGMSGTMYATGLPDGEPTRFPTPIADITTGMYTAISVVSALFSRTRTGKGQSIDNALLDSQVTWLANIGSSHLATGEPVKRIGNAHPSIVPYQPFPTADGWLIIGVGSERLWEKLLEVLECQELGKNPKFVNNAARFENKDELVPLLADYFRQKPTVDWLDKLQQARIPAGPIYSPTESLQNEHLLARGMVVEFEHPHLGLIRSIGNPMNLSSTPVSYRLPPPHLGEHTREILVDLGYSEEEIQQLYTNKIV